jgi:hypothetical protein
MATHASFIPQGGCRLFGWRPSWSWLAQQRVSVPPGAQPQQPREPIAHASSCRRQLGRAPLLPRRQVAANLAAGQLLSSILIFKTNLTVPDETTNADYWYTYLCVGPWPAIWFNGQEIINDQLGPPYPYSVC